MRTLNVRRRWDQGTSASPLLESAVALSMYIKPSLYLVVDEPHYATGASTRVYGMFCGIDNVNAHCEASLTLGQFLFYRRVRTVTRQLRDIAHLIISACGRASPNRISTYNRNRAGSMLHRCGSVSSTQPLRKRNCQ